MLHLHLLTRRVVKVSLWIVIFKSVEITLYSENQSCMLLSGVNSELGLNRNWEVDSFMSQYWLRFFSGLIFFIFSLLTCTATTLIIQVA